MTQNTPDEPARHLVRGDELETVEVRHPLNEASELHIRPLSRATGMTRLGISEGRLPPGREAFVYHSHHFEEEFLYILAGRGLLRADGATQEVGPGDFIGFPTPSVAHQLTNPFAEELIYLMGGENQLCEVGDFPDHGKRLYRSPGAADLVDLDHIEPLLPGGAGNPGGDPDTEESPP